ncbi:MAG: hypothetical protein HPZ86_03570 [Clostridia bacterium]|nr:hypothetical protein [Clostridia bacterium]
MKLKEIIAYEKSEMTPLRFKINYIVIPCLFVWAILCIASGVALMMADEKAFVVPFLVLLGAGLFPLLALLAATPLIRRREAEYELKKYSFLFSEVRGGKVEEKYVFETPCEDSLSCGRTRTEIGEQECGSDSAEERAEKIEEGFFDDCREYVALTKDKILWQGKEYFATDREANAYEWEYKLREYSYAETKITFFSSNALNRVRLSLLFEFPDGGFFTKSLTKELFSAVCAFGLVLENEKEWNYLLSHTKDAFRQILKYGEIRRAE